jgi:hypothetical protein
LRSEDRSAWVAPPAPSEEVAPVGEAGSGTPADASQSAAEEANVKEAAVPLPKEAVEVPVEPARSRP